MKIVCIKGLSLNTIVYRGFAIARDLIKISKIDVFDQSAILKGCREISETGMRDSPYYELGTHMRALR